jgi:hypothetical protein
MATENTQKEVLKHGEYTVKINQLIDNIIVTSERVVKPLTYEELADGWLRVSVKRRKMIHHFSIYLSQLPMNLWGKVKRSYTSDKTKDYYNKIKDGNYHYTIKYSVNDEKVLTLFRHIMSKTPDLEKIKVMYKELDHNRVKGWIMMYTLNMINRS